MTKENTKDLMVLEDLAEDVAKDIPKNNKAIQDKVTMVLDIAKLFSEAKKEV